ncbi:leucine zipper domain-containing protein [Streptomyces cyaneofuscatus]|uniref:leucine zipper domain-containing protein n=1 Tax=Streptomyces cyaneofuscatus TaxID=66883 RepID=UPI003EBEE96F
MTVHGGHLLIQRVRSSRPVAHVAEEIGVSRATAHGWVGRWCTEGDTGLFDRPSRPHIPTSARRGESLQSP